MLSKKLYQMQIDHVESDSKNLTATLNGKHKPDGYCDVVIRDIKKLAHECKCNGFRYAPRQCNQVAYHAARGIDFTSIRSTPSHLLQYIEYDVKE